MIKHVGIVSEGPTDYVVIKRIVTTIFNDESIQYRRLWPEDDCRGRSTGWKGVWDFCITELKENLTEYMNDISPKLDLIIVHLDGDVADEPEIYCPRQQGQCGMSAETNPLSCILSKQGKCPIPHGLTMDMNVEKRSLILSGKIDEFLGTSVHMQLIRCIPFESIETWIVCAFEGVERHNPPNNPIEILKKPADSIIAREAHYFGIKVDRESGKLKKRARVYEESFAPVVAEKWEEIKNICNQARVFEEELRTATLSVDRLLSRKLPVPDGNSFE